MQVQIVLSEDEFNKIKKEIYAEGREKRKEERDMGYVTDDCTSSYDMLKTVKEKLLESQIQNLNLLKKLYKY